MNSFTKSFILLLFFSGGFVTAHSLFARQDSVTVVAGAEYKRSALYKFLWGKNRRKEWTTPVRVPVLLLDSTYNGLTPYKKGGGNESKTLRLLSSTGKEYVIRSINKSREAVIPKLLRNTYFGTVIQDGVSMSYPYGALAVPVMMAHAGIYHTRPKLVYVPSQHALDTFDNVFANDLYLLEERPEGNWSDGAPHLGNFKNFYSTREVYDKMHDDGRYKADQHLFIKSRLFDILVADWDRNHDNWRWGASQNDTTIFLPVTRDRDQAFFTHTGIMMALLMPVMNVGFMQNFDHTIKNVGRLTKQDRALDEIFTNEMSIEDWLTAADQLRTSLTDSVIAASIAQLPPEIYALSGEELVEKLKSRRNDLSKYATAFYKVLAENVKVEGTINDDHFKLTQLPGGNVLLEIFSLRNGQQQDPPYFKRTFSSKETKSILINGFGGEDTFDIDPTIKSIRINTEHSTTPSRAFKEKSR